MNIFFLTQSKSLKLFNDISLEVSKAVKLTRCGFYVTDSSYYKNYTKLNRLNVTDDSFIIKEWEILEESRDYKFDINKLKDYEAIYGDPTLWNALVADRRLYFGKDSVREQDYASNYSVEKLNAILQKSIEKIESLFDSLKPDLVVSFICVTFGEYLTYLVARKRNIPFLNLRPTRIKNYFLLAESVHEPSYKVIQKYDQFKKEGIPENLINEIKEIVINIRNSHAMYEGVIPANSNGNIETERKQEKRSTATIIRNIFDRVKRVASDTWQYNFGAFRSDTHHNNRLKVHWFRRIKRPARMLQFKFLLNKRLISDKKKLKQINYAFFPLHKEPEVTLLVYSRPFCNQIEVIRNIARSLPIDMTLVVKEHPASIGYRPLSYYEKILGIPNVVMVPHTFKSEDLLHNSKLVTIISGSVGLEALIRKIPVINFGNTPFSFLPDTMIKQVTNINRLADEIADLIKIHLHDEDALNAYIGAVICSSIPVDFYSVLLGREGVYRPDGGDNYKHQVTRLTDSILKYVDCTL